MAARTKIELISSGTIDLLEDVPYSLTFAVADIREPENRNSSFSKTIKIPGSKNNNKIFNHIFEIDIDCKFNPNKKADCTLYIDEVQQIRGILQLLKITKLHNDKIEYSVCIKGNIGSIFSDWAEDYLTDLDFSSLNHTYDKATQKASWSATIGSGYVYPMIDYGQNNSNGLTFDVTNFYPAIYVKQYIDEIFSQYGYTYQSAFFNTNFFKRLIIPYNGTKLQLSAAELNSRYFEAKRGADYVADTLVASLSGAIVAVNSTYANYNNIVPIKIQINTDVSDVSNQFNTGTNIATLAKSGYYTFSAAVSFTVNFTGLSISPDTLLAGNKMNVHVCIFDSNNNYLSTIGAAYTEIPSQTISNGYTTPTYTVSFDTPTVYLNAGQKVGLAFTNNATVNYFGTTINPWGFYLGQPGTVKINILANSFFLNRAINNGLPDGTNIDFSVLGVAQNIKIKDFFKSIVKMFNLYIETDKTVSNKLYIEPRDDFYAAGTTIDWTDKLAIDRELELQPMGELQASRYTFQYKEDKDYYNTKAQNSYIQPYGTKNIDIDTNFVKGEKKIDVIFSATPISKIGTTDRIIPQILNVNSQNQILAPPDNINIRILYYGGVKNTGQAWSYTSAVSGTSSETTYPYCGHVDIPTNPTLDLSFGVPREIYYDSNYYTNNNLYNKYYRKYITEITDKDSKIVTGYFYLTPKDIYLLDFRNQFYIQGHLLRLNKIYDYNPIASELTKCEFIRIKEAVSFTADVNANIYGSGLTFTTGEECPNATGIGNWGVLGGGTTGGSGGGFGNVIDPTATYTSVYGNNNFVGAGVTNTTIFGSSGVTVMPGLTNVNIINTNNVLITQSGTNWVNGINYTDGLSEQGIVATPGGGQTNAYQTTKKFNLVETCATAGDSIRCAAAILDNEQTFKNVGVASMNVFPQSGERFRRGTTLLAVDAPYPVASRNTLHVYCYEPGIWTD